MVSPVVTGTGTWRLTRLMISIRSSTSTSSRKTDLVADYDRVDVAVALGERDRLLDFTLVALSFFLNDLVGLLIAEFFEPDTKRNLSAELGRNCRHELEAASRRISSDRSRVGLSSRRSLRICSAVGRSPRSGSCHRVYGE